MPKSLYRVFTAALLVAFVTTSAHAEHRGKKHKSFIDSFFGTPSERLARKKERDRKRALVRKNGNWWDNDADIVYSENRKQKKVDVDYGDPERIPGLGMGNLPYVLPKLQFVRDASLAKLAAPTVEGNAIRLVLADQASPIRASATIRDAVVEHYKSTGFAPVWTQNGKPTPRAEEVLKVLAAAGTEGLEPWRYLPAGLTNFDNPAIQIDGSALAAAQFDVGLTIAAVTYANHMSGGAFDPKKLSLYYDIMPEAVKEATALRILAYTPYPRVYLESLVPKHPAYAAFKEELVRLATETVTETPFPAGKRIKTGQKDARIPELRGRLIRLGHLDALEPVAIDSNPEVLDKSVAKALKDYQAAVGIPQTSALDTATVKAFNANTTWTNREKVLANMERLRWLPKDLGRKHVFVNQASYEVRVMDEGQPIWTSKVIVGRPTTQTNVFSDVVENVVFNPPWGMPQSILINEYLGKLRRDPGYFDRIGYKVTNSNGKLVSSRSINWGSVGVGSGIGVQQPPGDGNALGELKFNFPNSHAIYMHDTPQRHLFAESRRNFSHGCVRVYNPREFAAVLLGMGAEEIAARIDSGKSETVHLSEKIPVHLTYFTAWPDDMGKIQYFSDVYGRDVSLTKGFGVITKAFAPEETIKIVEASQNLNQNSVD